MSHLEMTTLDQAAYSLVHEYRSPDGTRGAVALAPRVGKAPRTLCNEVNPDVPGHKLGLAEAATLSLAAGDNRILHAFAGVLHHAVIPLPNYAMVSDTELLTLYAQWQARIGHTCQQIRDTLEDGRVEHHEVLEIRARAMDHIAAFFAMLNRFEALVDHDPAA